MQYYTFELDKDSQDMCTIVIPFGKYKYTRLPMGLKCSTDFPQEVMENVLHGIEDADVYLDDVGAFSNSWTDHLAVLDDILRCLKDNGFTVNPLEFMSLELAYSNTGVRYNSSDPKDIYFNSDAVANMVFLFLQNTMSVSLNYKYVGAYPNLTNFSEDGTFEVFMLDSYHNLDVNLSKKFFNNSALEYTRYVMQGDQDKIDSLKALLDRHEIKYGNATNGKVSGVELNIRVTQERIQHIIDSAKASGGENGNAIIQPQR